jgi:hypothetical protein
MAGLTELRLLSTKTLYQKLLSSSSDDWKIKKILLERQAAGYEVRFKEPSSTVPERCVDIDDRDHDDYDYLTPREDDTDLTRLVRAAYRSGYRGEGTREPNQSVWYMKLQMRTNKDEATIDHERTLSFWAMFRDKYAAWEIGREEQHR